MIIYTIGQNLTQYIQKLKDKGMRMGFVPTMGALHAGHLSLVDRSLSENDKTVVSIFVNPTQFDNPEDLAKYPRFLERDLYMLEKRNPEMIVYAPVPEDIYGQKVEAKKYDHGGLDRVMEGKFRPGHFDGVATVVHKLFEIVKPDRAYFGEKDFQQLQIIRRLVETQNLPVEIVPVEIVREEDGLAMSSRNIRLKREQRAHAPFIYQTLQKAREWTEASLSPEEIKKKITDLYKDHPVLKLEYFEIAEEKSLMPTRQFEKEKHYRAFIAVFAGDIRLIDNIRLK